MESKLKLYKIKKLIKHLSVLIPSKFMLFPNKKNHTFGLDNLIVVFQDQKPDLGIVGIV